MWPVSSRVLGVYSLRYRVAEDIVENPEEKL
jgi:hypothetical protein